MALMSCKVENPSPPANISMKASLAAAAFSSSLERHSLAGAGISSGTSSSKSSIMSLSTPEDDLMRMRSTMPQKFPSAPIGSCVGTGFPPKTASIRPTTLRKSASSRSMAVTKTMMGILCRFAGRSRALACFGSASRQASNTTTTPSMLSKNASIASSVYSLGPSRSVRLKEMLGVTRVSGHLRDVPEEPTPCFSNASRSALWTGFSLPSEKSYHL